MPFKYSCFKGRQRKITQVAYCNGRLYIRTSADLNTWNAKETEEVCYVADFDDPDFYYKLIKKGNEVEVYVITKGTLSVTEKFVPLNFRPKKPHIIWLFPYKTSRGTVDLMLLRIIAVVGLLYGMETKVVLDPVGSNLNVYNVMKNGEDLSTFVGKYRLD